MASKGPFKELLVIVHPNWLEHVSVLGLEQQRAREYLRDLYAQGMPESIDWERYRKAMFDIYGRAIIEASKRPDVLVAIFAVPMKFAEYRGIAEKDRDKIKKAEHSDVLRFIAFAKKLLGERLIVINSPGFTLRHDAERLVNIIRKKGIKFEREFTLRGGGELSHGCVSTVVSELKNSLKPSKTYVDARICGNLLIKGKPTGMRVLKRSMTRRSTKGSSLSHRKLPK